MVRDDRRIQPVPAPRGEGRGADEAERVRPQEVEARVPVEPLDVAGQEQCGDRPPSPLKQRSATRMRLHRLTAAGGRRVA